MRLAPKVITQCPQCGGRFEVSMAQLQLRKGFVRCVQCATIFDGYETVVDEAGAAAPSSAAFTLPAQTPPPPVVIRQRHTISAPSAAGDATVGRDAAFSISDAPPPSTQDEPVWHLTTNQSASLAACGEVKQGHRHLEPKAPLTCGGEAPTARSEFFNEAASAPSAQALGIYGESRTPPTADCASLPDFLEDNHRPGWRPWVWGVLCLLALLLLLAQAAVIYRVQLASQTPILRPALERLCDAWGCQVGYPRRLDQIVILSSSLRMQPGADPASPESRLTLDVTLRNQDARAQQWPSLQLSLTDVSGAVVIRKHLHAADYLPANLADKPFAAGSELALRLPLRVQGVTVNGYQIKPFFP